MVRRAVNPEVTVGLYDEAQEYRSDWIALHENPGREVVEVTRDTDQWDHLQR